MTKKRTARLALLTCASVAAIGLIGGASPAAAKTKTLKKTFTQCQNLALPLVSNSDSPLTLPPSPVQQVAFSVPKTPKGSKPVGGKITGASVGVRITHSFDADVTIYLVSPSGQFLPLDTGHGGSANDFGTGTTNCTGTLTTFSDLAPTSISAGTPPYAGSFKPDSPFASLNGRKASGVWTVVLTDTTGGDDGTIHAVSLTLNYQYKQTQKK